MADELDSLFAASPAKFIEERKRIVAALKGAGRKDEAKAVEKIPRPSVAVWVVNQIARRDPEGVRRLGAITERLQAAAGAEYGAAAAEHRQVLGTLRDRANEILTEAGHEAGAQIVQKVVANLRAATGNAETRATLERGRLERDLEDQAAASLFGMAGAATEAPGPPPAPAKKSATGAKPKAAETERDAKAEKAAKEEAKARAKAIAGAEREVKRLRDEAAAARKDAERAERAVAAAQEALAAAEKKLAAERVDADAAADALAAAEAELARLSET